MMNKTNLILVIVIISSIFILTFAGGCCEPDEAEETNELPGECLPKGDAPCVSECNPYHNDEDKCNKVGTPICEARVRLLNGRGGTIYNDCECMYDEEDPEEDDDDPKDCETHADCGKCGFCQEDGTCIDPDFNGVDCGTQGPGDPAPGPATAPCNSGYNCFCSFAFSQDHWTDPGDRSTHFLINHFQCS